MSDFHKKYYKKKREPIFWQTKLINAYFKNLVKNGRKKSKFTDFKNIILFYILIIYGERGDCFKFLRVMSSTIHGLLSFDVSFMKIGPLWFKKKQWQSQKINISNHIKINTFSLKLKMGLFPLNFSWSKIILSFF